MSHSEEARKLDLPVVPAAAVTCPADRIHSDTFPYLVVFLTDPLKSAVPVVTVLPVSTEHDQWDSLLVDSAEIFHTLNGIQCCLVLNDRLCAWFVDDGGGIRSSEPPKGGFFVSPENVESDEVRRFLEWFRHLDQGGAETTMHRTPELPPGERFKVWGPVEGSITIPEDEKPDVSAIAREVVKEWQCFDVDGWNGDELALANAVTQFEKLMGHFSTTRIAAPVFLEDLVSYTLEGEVAENHLLLERFRAILEPFVRVFQQAGLYEDIETALAGSYTHTGLSLGLLDRTLDRLLPEESLQARWEVAHRLLVPAVVVSASNLWRIDTWLRAYREIQHYVQLADPTAGERLPLDEIEQIVLAGKAAFRAGAEYFVAWGNSIYVIPAARIKLNEGRDLHCEDGPAVVDLSGKEHYFLNGKQVNKRLVMSPQSFTDEEIDAEGLEKQRELMITRRAAARYALLRSGAPLDPSFLFRLTTEKKG